MSKQFDSRDCFQFWMELGKKFFQNCAEANPKISCAYSTRCLLQDPNKYDPCWATAGPSFVKQVATIFEMIRSFFKRNFQPRPAGSDWKSSSMGELVVQSIQTLYNK